MLHNYGKIHHFFNGKINYFLMVMFNSKPLNYQRVTVIINYRNNDTQMLHVWNIQLQNWVIFGVNVGKYIIHGASGWILIDSW